MEMLQGVCKQHLRPRAVVGYGVKIFLPSPPNYVTRSPGIFFPYFDSGQDFRDSPFMIMERNKTFLSSFFFFC